MRFLGNVVASEVAQTTEDLLVGHDGKRSIIIDRPRPSIYSVEELVVLNMVGIYQVGTCTCDSCIHKRKEKYYKPLNDWRNWNAARGEEADGNR